MARINDHYQKLAAGYLFPEIGRRVGAFQSANPKADVIRLGIGDVVLPLAASVRQAMHAAVDESRVLPCRHGSSNPSATSKEPRSLASSPAGAGHADRRHRG